MTPVELEQLANVIALKVADHLSQRPRLVDRYELSKIIGLSVPTIDRYRKSGLIPNIQVGGRVLFDPTVVITALQRANESQEGLETAEPTDGADDSATLVQSKDRD